MAQRALTFLETKPNMVSFVDPTNIDNRLTQKLEVRKKQMGRTLKARNIRLDASQQRNYAWKSNPADTVSVPDQVYARVILSGVDAAELALVWEDIKANVDTMIAANALTGIPAALTTSTFVIDKT